MKRITVGIFGGSGYTGGELIRVLLNHPNAEIKFVHSRSNAGKRIAAVHTDLIGETELRFVDECSPVDVCFLCVAHGEAKALLQQYPGLTRSKLIDLSQDHRIGEWTYGLPELNRKRITNASFVANPGCFATAIQLALLPLAKAGQLKSEIHVSATTGSTGAGQRPTGSSHFSWRQNNLSIYKAFAHQHLAEIVQSIQVLQGDFDRAINFIPQRGGFTRGIFGSAYTHCDLAKDELTDLYSEFYSDAAFVHVCEQEIDLKQVVNTNKCLLKITKAEDNVMITFCIDNLLKGASGQAVQNMNLLFGLDEKIGLKLKASYF